MPRLYEFTKIAGLLLLLVSEARGQSALDGFDPNANGAVRVVVVQPDGKILIGGRFTTFSPNGGTAVARHYMARLNPDGSLDTAFNPGVEPVDPGVSGDYLYVILSIALQPDGKILAGGQFTSIGGQTRAAIARLDATTGLADSFNPRLSNWLPSQCWVYSIAVQADGQILAGGNFQYVGADPRWNIARFDATTGLPDGFHPVMNYPVYSLAAPSEGNIFAGGYFTNVDGQTRNHIVRLGDYSFDPNANSFVESIAVQADGNVLVGGYFTTLSPNGGVAVTRNYIARLKQDGTLDTAFNPNANGRVYAIAVQADGNILAGGEFTSIGGQTRNRIARLDATTGLADSFDPNANDAVLSIAVQADGSILAGGEFTSIGGQTRNHIARLAIAPTLPPTPTPTTTPTPAATPAPTPTPITISGTISYCSNLLLLPVPGVTLNLTGTMTGSALSDGSGNYTLSSVSSGGNYVVTPTKAARLPASAGINTSDVIATQKHVLNIGTPLSGCRLTAADVDGDTSINTVDVIAIQRFVLGLSTGIANTGKYQFSPVNRSYPGVVSDQTAQNYDTLIFGDVASPFAN